MPYEPRKSVRGPDSLDALAAGVRSDPSSKLLDDALNRSCLLGLSFYNNPKAWGVTQA